MHRDIKALKRMVDENRAHAEDRADFQGGRLDELAQQIFGVHILQEMLCEKAGITEAEVRERIELRRKALEEQERVLREAAEKAHADAQAEKERLKTEALTTETAPPALAGVAAIEAPNLIAIHGVDQPAGTTEQPVAPAGDAGEEAPQGPNEDD